MKYTASVSDFFKAPQWGMNLLLGAVTLMIPVVGPIVLAGWHITGFWARRTRDEPEAFPPFDFQDFGKYLGRGVWPFLVNLVASLALVPLVLCSVIPLLVFSGIVGAGHKELAGISVAAALAGICILQLGLTLVYQLVAAPLMLRATITQDFKSSFDPAFVRDLLSRVWKEVLASMLFMFGLGLCLMVVTVITCYIGLFFAAPLLIFSWHHLQKQLYQLHLARGGQPVPLSPKLNDLPPPLPAA